MHITEKKWARFSQANREAAERMTLEELKLRKFQLDAELALLQKLQKRNASWLIATLVALFVSTAAGLVLSILRLVE